MTTKYSNEIKCMCITCGNKWEEGTNEPGSHYRDVYRCDKCNPI